MPAPPARMRSASVPCGLNSSSSSFERNCRSNSLFSPTYDETIFLICRVSNNRPRPKPSTPALLEMTVRLFAPESRNARIRFSGMPHSPKPPDITVMPSRVRPASADFASANTFFDWPVFDWLAGIDLLRRVGGREGRQVIAVLPDQREARITGRLHAEALRRVHLRHQAAISHGRRVAEGELAGHGVAFELRLVGIQPSCDPLLEPGIDSRIVKLQHFLEIAR